MTPLLYGLESSKTTIEEISHAQIHRVLLEGGVQPVRATPSFQDFAESLDLRQPLKFISNISADLQPCSSSGCLIVTCIIQSAYRDSLCVAMKEHRSLDPAKSLLISLHDKIRSLIPSRIDLHDQLSDHIRERKKKGVLIRIITAAQALEQLESEARAETTNAWISVAHKLVDEGLDSSMTEITEEGRGLDISDSFLITSVMYLLLKAELCEQDKQEFYLARQAKYILDHGLDMERSHFIGRFGELSIASAPDTRKWIETVVKRATPDIKAKLKNSSAARHDLVYSSWISDLLFADEQLNLPEVFALDLNGLKGIREVTRIAAAGSALALHACNAAGKSASILEEPDDDAVYRCRAAMVLVMNERHGKSQIEYESIVSAHVVALAKVWNPMLDSSAVNMLRSRTLKVLRGEDAVIRVLEGRVSTAFATFSKYGMVFYASDLALAASTAYKIVDLCWRVFAAQLLEPMILQVLE
ncbi:hypothetical protein MPSEU_000518900 [Mayamaea pseudoterrestris]|nr:hypothetical protein MPSEU_000518900 [Mayamaea pseudoterrestris]